MSGNGKYEMFHVKMFMILLSINSLILKYSTVRCKSQNNIELDTVKTISESHAIFMKGRFEEYGDF